MNAANATGAIGVFDGGEKMDTASYFAPGIGLPEYTALMSFYRDVARARNAPYDFAMTTINARATTTMQTATTRLCRCVGVRGLGRTELMNTIEKSIAFGEFPDGTVVALDSLSPGVPVERASRGATIPA